MGSGALLELLVFETPGEQMAAIANIDLVSLCDALGVENPRVKMRRDMTIFCLSVFGHTRAPRL